MKGFLLRKLAKQIDKEEFLKQLKDAWRPLLKSKSVARETSIAYARVRQSDMKEVFDIVGITEEDIRKVIRGIVDEGKEASTG